MKERKEEKKEVKVKVKLQRFYSRRKNNNNNALSVLKKPNTDLYGIKVLITGQNTRRVNPKFQNTK